SRHFGALFLVAMTSCYQDYVRPEDPARAWLYDLGANAASWEPCLRIGTRLRAECGNDEACARRASDQLSLHCYAGHYRGHPRPVSASRSTSETGTSPSPCFLSHGARVTEICRRLKLQEGPCEAELRYFVDDVCHRGDPTLTGVGP